MTANTNTMTRTRTSERTNVAVQAEISRGAVATMVGAVAIVGLWSFASLVGGLVVASGPITLAQSWFGALLGM